MGGGRQLPATRETIGMPKVEALKARLLTINPEVQRCEERGSLMQVTAVFGCTLASLVIDDIRKASQKNAE